MNNFHFNPSSNRSVQLQKQLELMNRDIEESKKQLQKKNLQLEFYQDPDYVNNKPSLSQKHIKYPQNSINNNNIQNNSSKNVYENLADQIMNDLLQDNKSKPIRNPNPTSNPYQKQNDIYQNPSNNLYQNKNNNLYQNQNNFNPFIQHSQQNQNIQPIPTNNQPQPSPFLPRQNNFIPQNKRQLEKQKLQNPSSYEQNPFIPKQQPVKRSIETKQQKPIVNQRQLQKLKLQQQSALNQNPFWGQNKNRSQQKPNPNKNNINYQQYQNVREKQKEKLQQQLHQNKDFGVFQRPTSPNQYLPQKDVQSQNISKKAAFQNRYSNPFVKDQDYLRQLKQQQQREYRRVLQQQKKLQEERKKHQKQKVKQERYAFNSYQPGTAANTGSSKNVNQQNDIPIKSPNLGVTKKVDPNGRPPVYNYEQGSKSRLSSSQREYMRMKANELKDNFKRGRILHDQYLSQVKKLAEYYKVDYRELVDRKDLDDKEENLPWIKDKKQEQPIKIQEDKNKSQQFTERKQNQSQNYQIMQNQQSLQKFPDSQPSLKNNSYEKQHSSPSRNPSFDPYSPNPSQQPYYGQFPPNQIPGLYTQNLSANPQQYGLASTSFLQQMQGVDYDLMRRMFQEMKAMRSDYTKSLQKQKAFLQQTFMKFLANGAIQNQNQIQNTSQNKNQKASDLSPRQNKKQQNILTDNSQQSYNEQSMEFIQKSLSGIVNKIPFYSNSVNRSNNSNTDPSFMMGTPQQNINKKQPNKINQKIKNPQSIEQFFSKPYKCKKFKKFSIMVDVSQSSMQIPNVSNFLALKNGKDVLNKLFEEDLLMMKKLQRQRDVDKLRNRVDNQLSYGNQPSSHQSSSIQQVNYNSQQVSYGQPPGYANYGQTFNRNQNTGQFMIKEEKKITVSKSNNFEEYENYSRSKQREVRSAHQVNHRSYKKADQSVPDTFFLKRHVSGQQQNLPDFADQSDIKARSPVYYSPKLSSQILEQDEYQTAQKSTNQQLLESQFYGSSVVKKVVSPEAKQSTNKKYKMKKKDYAYEEERQSQKKSKSKSKDKSLSFKEALRENSLQKDKQSNLQMMKMITKNNQVLKKYQISPQNKNDFTPRDEEVDIREYSSINSNPPKEEDLKNYFSGVNNQNSNQQNSNYKLPPLVANLKNLSSNQSDPAIEKKLSNKFNTQKQDMSIYDRQQSIEEIKSDNDDLQEDRSEYVSSNRYPTSRHQNQGNYQASQQQTVKSINYSVTSSRRPPQSIHISQTVESIDESASKLMKPPLNKKRSTSRKKQSSIIRTKFQKDSILQKPPPSESQMSSMIQSDDDHDIVVGKQPLKFDSNVYDSEYEQSVSQKDLQKRISQLQNQQKLKISQPQINVSPPVIANSKSNVLNVQSIDSKSSLMGGSKLKSLQQARNLAKQSKKKSINLNENDQMFKYEQKMSELESFLTKRQESSIIKQTKETKTIKLAIQKSPAQKKNIMNLLDELQNESSYRDDFESYREQSQRPKY